MASVRVKAKGIYRESPRCSPGTLLIQCRLHKTKKHTAYSALYGRRHRGTLSLRVDRSEGLAALWLRSRL